MRAEEFAIQIAADSVAKLHMGDVWRVLESCPLSSVTNPNGTARKVAAYIKKNRPDLAEEVNAYLKEVLA
jgi:hypothetical protein